jgi:hypothetical protein
MAKPLVLFASAALVVGCGGVRAPSAPDASVGNVQRPGSDGGAGLDLASADGAASSPPDLTTTDMPPSNGPWRTMSSTGEPERRSEHTAVWTGTKMIVWGGVSAASGAPVNSGGIYDPATDSWTATSTTGAPSPRVHHAVVWTGSEMVVWGGDTGSPSYTQLGDGARYDPATDHWTAISSQGAPSARTNHSAVWTGSEMIVWGGLYSGSFGQPGNGARYRPSEDRWYAMTSQSAPIDGQDPATTVWTGSDMIAWIGDYDVAPAPAGHYDPALDQWQAITTSGEPSLRQAAQAVWTGSDVIVFGGAAFDSAPFVIGARYHPPSETWQTLATSGEPETRKYFVSVWTGAKMIVWGGQLANSGLDASGAIYDPSLDIWTAMPLPDDSGLTNQQRYLATGVWTGTELMIWGGVGTYDTKPLPGLRYKP